MFLWGGFSAPRTYDSRGNRTSMIADGVTTNYTYDKNNRLLHTDTNGAMVDYNYDNNGNLYSKLYSRITPATGETEGISLELFGQAQAAPVSLAMEEQPLTSEELSAIMEQEPGKSVKEILAERRPAMFAAAKKEKTAEFFTYNERGQLTGYTDGTTTASYTYGADGYRKSKTVNGKTTNHIWDGDQLTANVGEARGKFYRAGREILAGETQYSMGLCTHFTDGHGNTTRITVKTAETFNPWISYMDIYEYDAYGNQDGTYIDEWSNPFQYCGEYYDEETGMTYLRARYYDPSIGRFISEDPVKDGLNWYVYCANDPVNAWDPSGMIPTSREAAAMADHIYHWDQNSPYEKRQVRYNDDSLAGWRLIDVWRGNESMKMGIYIRDMDDWQNPSEYALVYRGSILELNWETAQVWYNNVQRSFSSNSTDTWDAINSAKYFANTHSQEVTMIGHSKGGAEAAAAAAATGSNAILFNPADPNLPAYNLDGNSYTGNMTQYIIKGEILSSLKVDTNLFGLNITKQAGPVPTSQVPNINTNWIDTKYYVTIKIPFGNTYNIPDPIANHKAVMAK